jgi:hypothetical protein
MPQTECAQCGTPYESSPALSTENVRKSLFRARAASVIALCIAVVSLGIMIISQPEKPKSPTQYEHTGVGVIRYYDSSKRLLMIESSYGIKILQPICQKELSVYIHMRTDITFRWDTWHTGRGPDAGEECYDINNVKRIMPDAP